jgi:hypothetical protein
MKDLQTVIAEVEVEREYQRKEWPEDYNKRPFEEWLICAHTYMQEAMSEYTHKKGNSAARAKLVKVANLVLWGLQSEKVNEADPKITGLADDSGIKRLADNILSHPANTVMILSTGESIIEDKKDKEE